VSELVFEFHVPVVPQPGLSADLPCVPEGVYAVVTDDASEEMGAGRRVEL
jgi:hypothetical protein